MDYQVQPTWVKFVTVDQQIPKLKHNQFEVVDQSPMYNTLYDDLIDIELPNTKSSDIKNIIDKFEVKSENTIPQEENISSMPSNLQTAISNHLGETYSNSKRLSKGFSDCSGFVNKVYGDLGINLGGASSIHMYNKLTDHITFDQVQPGDLVFLTPKYSHNVAGTNRRAGVDASHVAIVVEKQGTRIKVAENTGHRKKSDYSWYELGGADKPSGNGVINYSKGNRGKNKNELLGFGRLRV